MHEPRRPQLTFAPAQVTTGCTLAPHSEYDGSICVTGAMWPFAAVTEAISFVVVAGLGGGGACVSADKPVVLSRFRRSKIGHETVPIQVAQCWFPGLAISCAKIYVYFLNKMHASNVIKQHSETVTVSDSPNADCSSKNKFILCHLL